MEIQPISSFGSHQQNPIDEDELLRNISDEVFFQHVPPGYRFRPTDQELIVKYLTKKLDNKPLPRNKINDVMLYEYNPETLSLRFDGSGGKDLYFFTPRNRKYKNGQRPNRRAGDGYWKATGADKNILNSGGKLVGFRKALVFYVGKPPKGVKTSWIMHEYRVEGKKLSGSKSVDAMRLDDWVLCRIYKKINRTINTKNSIMEIPEDNAPNVDDFHEDEETIEIDGADSKTGRDKYENFEMPYDPSWVIIDNPAAQFNPWNTGFPSFPPTNIIGAGDTITGLDANMINHHQQLYHPTTGFGTPWPQQHSSYVAENSQQAMESINGNEYGLTHHNNSYLDQNNYWHSAYNFQPLEAAVAGLTIHNPYQRNSPPPHPSIINGGSTAETQTNQHDTNQF